MAVNFPKNPLVNRLHEENGVVWRCTHTSPTRWAKSGDLALDEWYLGSKEIDPTLDNRNLPLAEGQVYWNLLDKEIRYYDGLNWSSPTTEAVLASVTANAAANDIVTLSNLQAMQDLYNTLNVNNGVLQRETFTATANQTTFTVTGGYSVGSIDVYQNGLKLVNGEEVNVSNGTDVVLLAPAALNDKIEVVGFNSFSVTNTYSQAQVDSKLFELEFNLSIGL